MAGDCMHTNCTRDYQRGKNKCNDCGLELLIWKSPRGETISNGPVLCEFQMYNAADPAVYKMCGKPAVEPLKNRRCADHAFNEDKMRAFMRGEPARDVAKEGEDTKQTLAGGATRTKSDVRFDLIPPEAVLRLARRFAQGAAKHGENNWRKGNWEFVVSCFAHLEHHLNKLKQNGNAGDDNLGAILWNATALAWYEVHRPDEFSRALMYIVEGV